jgi:hypothetical protein
MIHIDITMEDTRILADHSGIEGPHGWAVQIHYLDKPPLTFMCNELKFQQLMLLTFTTDWQSLPPSIVEAERVAREDCESLFAEVGNDYKPYP